MSRKLKGFKTCIAATALLICSSPLARAADNCTGVDVLVTQTGETTEIAKNHTVTIWKAFSVLSSHDSIYNNTTGTQVTGGGGPAFTDPPYEYTLDAADAVPALVEAGAGPK